MNDKSGGNTNKGEPQLFRVDDVAYSDSDTVPEFSSKGSLSPKELSDDGEIILIKHSEINEKEKEKFLENLNNEEKLLNRSLKNYRIFVAPHQSTILFASSLNKKINCSTKSPIHVANDLAEPNVNKSSILNSDELKNLKIFIKKYGIYPEKEESCDELSKRIELAIRRVLNISSMVIIVCGPIIFEKIFEILLKNRKTPLKPNLLSTEHFIKTKNEWRRVSK